MLGWAATLFARNPAERAKLVADPSKIPNAVEELLRYEAPSPVQARRTTRDVELHGEVVPKGSAVLLLTASLALVLLIPGLLRSQRGMKSTLCRLMCLGSLLMLGLGGLMGTTRRRVS